MNMPSSRSFATLAQGLCSWKSGQLIASFPVEPMELWRREFCRIILIFRLEYLTSCSLLGLFWFLVILKHGQLAYSVGMRKLSFRLLDVWEWDPRFGILQNSSISIGSWKAWNTCEESHLKKYSVALWYKGLRIHIKTHRTDMHELYYHLKAMQLQVVGCALWTQCRIFSVL